ncbi:ABC transporter permease [Candidatus Sumerlaeota bacterium]|nr:ABC transporter permease [Candidatus Sumerlaeota bacterium]
MSEVRPPAAHAELDAPLSSPPRSPMKIAWRRLMSNVFNVAALITVIVIILFSFAGPMFTPWDYDEEDDAAATFEAPSAHHWLGTDGNRRDILARVMLGGRISLLVGFIASAISVLIGIVYGAVSGFVGGWVDKAMMRFVDILYSIPLMLFVILLMVIIGPGLKSIFLALAFFYWLTMARIVRGQVLQLRQTEYILAARALGAGPVRIIFWHLIPNTLGPVIVTLTLNIPQAIFTEAYLSYLGLGVPAPMASWGTLANDGLQSMGRNPTLLIAASVAISLTMLAFNYLGDALRDAFDPRLHRD